MAQYSAQRRTSTSPLPTLRGHGGRGGKIRRAAKCHLLSRHSCYNYDHTVALAAAPTRSTPVGPISCQSLIRGQFLEPCPCLMSDWQLVSSRGRAVVGFRRVLIGEPIRLQQTAPNPLFIQTALVKLSGLQTKKIKCEKWICREG